MDPEIAHICAVLKSEENTFRKASKWTLYCGFAHIWVIDRNDRLPVE
jgi:hypothetical protein